MTIKKIPLFPRFPYKVGFNFWEQWKAVDTYRTAIATSTSTIKSATLRAKITPPTNPFGQSYGTIIIKVNDNEVLHWAPHAPWRERFWEGTIDISSYIMPAIGYPNTAANKISFVFENLYFPLWGCEYSIDYAYVELEYTGEIPAYPSGLEEGEGLFGLGPEWAGLIGGFMNLMIMIMFMSLMISLGSSFAAGMAGRS